MPEGVEKPTRPHLDTELLPAKALAVLNLPHEQLASRLHVVRHHVHAADNFQPSFGDKPAECLYLLRITLEKRLDISDLIEREFVVRVHLQEAERLQNIGQTHLQIAFASLEHGPLPVRVG